MRDIKVILISGKAGSGKDTVAEIIKEKLQSAGNKVVITHYADMVKYVCEKFFSWNGVKDERGRHLLQLVGTDIGRRYDPNIWVNFVITLIECFCSDSDYVLIPDCRFPNEVSVIKNKFDTILLKVNRPELKSKLTIEQQNHQSETALDNVIPDYCIENTATLHELEYTVNHWMKQVLYIG